MKLCLQTGACILDVCRWHKHSKHLNFIIKKGASSFLQKEDGENLRHIQSLKNKNTFSYE